MKKNTIKSTIRKMTVKKNRAVSEVISSLLLVTITVVGAVILTTFLDETFVSGGLAVSSTNDNSIKGIKLIAFDTRDGSDLMGYANLDNGISVGNTDHKLCRESCNVAPDNRPDNGGTEFMVIQIENNNVNSIFIEDVGLNDVNYDWDVNTNGIPLDGSASDASGGDYPSSGMFSIVSSNDSTDTQQTAEVLGGQKVNLIIKLDSENPDIQLSKTMQIKINIGAPSLSKFLVESGGAQ
jgi:flagellin-like protein